MEENGTFFLPWEYFVFFLLKIFSLPNEQALIFQVELVQLKSFRRASLLALEVLPFELLNWFIFLSSLLLLRFKNTGGGNICREFLVLSLP